MFTRRSFLTHLGFTGLAFSSRFAHPLLGQTHGGSHLASPSLSAFVDALPIPPVLKPTKIGVRDVYKISMQSGLAKCHRDLPLTNILGFNGLYPGPTIRATKNRAVQVVQVNNLPGGGAHSMDGGETHYPSVHLHGALVAPDSDGHPNDGIQGGAARTYLYPNRQRGCGLWYHDHTHGATGYNVYMGLAGFYFVDDPAEKLLRLPRGAYEIPLLIQDRVFGADGQLAYSLDDTSLEMGHFGDVVLVNGKIQPYLNVANRKYRFRILNGSNARHYTLALSTGEALIQIGTDGGLLQRPVAKASVKIAPSERVDLIVDFSTMTLGSSVILQNQGGEGRTGSLMQFKVNRMERDNAVIPQFLKPWEELETPAQTREFTLNRTTLNGKLTWTINGYAFETPGRPVPQPKLNTVEHWRFVNPTNHPHPMHLHLVQFQVLNIDGEPQDPADFGWKDTVVVPPSSEVTIATKFSAYQGKYVFHCHNLEHEDYAMMSEFEVVA
jgi:spore coat protein A